jgi:hypothetical protein
MSGSPSENTCTVKAVDAGTKGSQGVVLDNLDFASNE